MEKNVGSVDIDELKKAREELNRERGIENDPNMYSDYNPNRKAEEANQPETVTNGSENEMEEVPFEDTASFDSAEENGFETNSNTQSSQESTQEQSTEVIEKTENLDNFQGNNPAGDEEKDFSVYDNFSEFDIIGEDVSNSQNAETESQFDNADLISTDEGQKTEAPLTSVSESAASDSNSQNDSTLKAEQKSANVSKSDSNSSDEDSAETDNFLEELENIFSGDDETSENEEETSDDSKIDSSNEQSNEQSSEQDENEAENEAEILKILESADFDNEETESQEKTEPQNETEPQKDIEPQEEIEPQNETELQEADELMNFSSENVENQGENLVQDDKFLMGLNESQSESESKINEFLKKSNMKKSSENQSRTRIESVDFIDLIGSNEFEKNDKFTYALGRAESGEFEFAKIKDMFNVAVFSQNEENVYKLISSLMLSLMLKNTTENINFLICDTKPTSIFESFMASSFLQKPIAKNQSDIEDLLVSLVSEIDSRYESIAISGTKNIDEYNLAMEKSYIAGYPYTVLIFNNYSSTFLSASQKISDSISYILKFGKLVGVYVYMVSQEPIVEDGINFFLATRVSFPLSEKEMSLKALGVFGAETLGDVDEFVVKTIYSEKLKHVKVPNITQREVQLLIENIEG